MRKAYKKISIIMIFILLFNLIKCTRINAAEEGSTIDSAIQIQLGAEYSKIWTNDDYNSNLYNEFTMPARGVITFNITKPVDSKGNVKDYTLSIYNSNGELEWKAYTGMLEHNLLESSYQYKIGLNQGKYYMNIYPSFYVSSGSITTKYSFNFEANDYYEIESNDTKQRANQLKLNQMYSATYCEEYYDTNKSDYFKVDLIQGEKYKIIIENLDELLDGTTCIISLINTENVEKLIKSNFKRLTETEMYYEYTAENTGICYIKLYNCGSISGIDYKIGVYYDIIPIESIQLDKTSMYLAKGGSATLNVNFNPSNTNDDRTITWTSSDTSVVTVSNGTVKGISEGTATITATTQEGKTSKCNVSVSCLPFNDIKTTDWFYEAIKYTYQKDIIKGANEAEFKPNVKLTRGMLVTILYRMEGEPSVSGTIGFPDVKTSQYYYNAVKWASDRKIVSGYNSGKFGPDDNITREQLAVILRKYAKYKGKDVSRLANISSYEDASKVSSFAKEGVQWAIAKGIISGKNNGTRIDPQGPATRAEAATMIYNYCTKIK